jgi:hypothetical protein
MRRRASRVSAYIKPTNAAALVVASALTPPAAYNAARWARLSKVTFSEISGRFVHPPVPQACGDSV